MSIAVIGRIPLDDDRNPVLGGLSNADGATAIPAYIDSATNAVLVKIASGGSSGTQYVELATTSPATGTLALGRYQTSLPTLTNGQMNEPQLDSSSRLLVVDSAAATSLSTIVTNTGNTATSANQTNGNQQVQGNVASAVSDSGNPVKVAGVYNSTTPTFTTGQRADIQMGSRGSMNVTLFGSNSATAVLTSGSGADGVSNSSASLFMTSLSAIFNGTTWDRLRSGGVTGMLGVSLQASPSGGYSFSHLSANGTTTIKSGAGTLHTVTINNAGATDTVTIYDNTAGSGTVIAVIGSSSEATFTYDAAFATGLTVVIAGTTAPDVTFTYK